MFRRLLAAVLVLSAGYAYALPPAEYPDRNLAGCHILYSSVRREANGNGWRTDYPWGQRNLLIRLSELTKTRVSAAGRIPHVWLVRLSDPALFECSYLMASDVGTIGLSDEEAAVDDLSLDGRGETRPASQRDRLLARERRRHLGARRGDSGAALPRHS